MKARIKIGFYVELADFRPGELGRAQELIEKLQALGENGRVQTKVIPDFDAAVDAARSLPPSPTIRDIEQEAWTLNILEQNDWIVSRAAEQLGITNYRLSTRLQHYKKRGVVKWEGSKWKRT